MGEKKPPECFRQVKILQTSRTAYLHLCHFHEFIVNHMTLARDPAFQPLAARWQHCMFQITLNTDMRIKFLDFSSSLILSADKGIKN